MCGRYSFSKANISDLLKRFDLIDAPSALAANDHVVPTVQVPVIFNDSPRQLSCARWGLIPSWFSEERIKDGLINARAETISEKPAFKNPIRTKRCLILADSFYEWKKVNGKKRPFRILLKDENIFTFAGIWDIWKGRGTEIRSCAIITTAPNAVVKDIHDRMPVILPKEKEKLWLGNLPLNDAVKMLVPYEEKPMKAYEVSLRVNSPAVNDSGLFEPVIGHKDALK